MEFQYFFISLFTETGSKVIMSSVGCTLRKLHSSIQLNCFCSRFFYCKIFEIIIIPVGITAQTSEQKRKELVDLAKEIEKELATAELRAECDLRENYSPGWKFNYWELKGVPLRIEIGPKDMAADQVYKLSFQESFNFYWQCSALQQLAVIGSIFFMKAVCFGSLFLTEHLLFVITE